MAECFACSKGMNEADGCDPGRTIVIDGDEYDPIPHGEGFYADAEDREPAGRCHDCGAKVGEVHHPGCDMEQCPECDEQYFICGCETDEKDRIWGDA